MKQHIEQQRSKEVYTYCDETQMWDDQTVPPMPTARDSPGVLSVPSALIVAGGDMSPKRQETNAVDVFKTDTSQWHCTTALPTACQIVRLVAIGNRCYALGGVKGSENFSQVLYASVDDLLHNQIHSTHTSTSSTQSTWKTLPDTPNYRPAAAVVAGNLLAIGGKKTSMSKDGTDAKKEIYKYSHCTSSWIHISDLPIPLHTDAAVLSSTEILVIGGWDGEQKRAVVYKGCLSISGHLDQPDTRHSVPSKGVSKKPILKDLQKEFHTKVADLWEDIGIQLDIDQGLLNKLKADNNIGNTGNCLREMFKAWLRKCDPSPAWSAIVEALGALGQEDLAQYIRKKYL